MAEDPLVLRRPQPRPKRSFGQEKHAVIAAIADARTRISGPPIDERLKSIVASAVGYCLKGGSDFELIRNVAVNLAATDPRKLAQLAMHVRQEEERARETEHFARKRRDEEEAAKGRGPYDWETVRAQLAAKGMDTTFLDQALAKRQRKREQQPMRPCSGCAIVGPDLTPLGTGEYCAICLGEIKREKDLARPDVVQG